MNFQILEFKGESDHIHALIEYPPKLSISQIVNALKGVSSRRYGQAGYPCTVWERCASRVLAILLALSEAHQLKYLNNTLESKKSRARSTGF
jgi:REP element-mobilizing transposase RayT